MTQYTCPKCEANLPETRDAFCPSCREPIEWDEATPLQTNLLDIKMELRILEANIAFRNNPTIATLYRQSLPRYVISAMLLFFSVAIAYLLVSQLFAILCIGVVVGVYLRDFGWIRRIVLMWPISNSFIDWNYVENRIEELKAKQTPTQVNSAP